MKKTIVLMGILFLVFSNLSWAAGTIDEITITGHWPFTVDIRGTYPDGCDRGTEIATVFLEEQRATLASLFVDVF